VNPLAGSGLGASDVALSVAIVAAGSALQASIGFGVALVAAPLLVIVDRRFVPGPLLAAALLLTVIMAVRERAAIDVHGLRAAVWGRLLGTPPAALLVGAVSSRTFDLVFGLLVLSAVGVSLVHRAVTPTRRSVFLASVASGFMGTASSIGGPPLALVYQNADGPRLRSTLATLFAMGSVLSITALAAVGRFGAPELVRAAVLLPGVVLGVAASGPLARALDRAAARPFVLGLSGLAALAVLGRAVF